MNIATENLNKVKNNFSNKVEWGKMKIDSDYPFYNAYQWKGEILFSEGYASYNGACVQASQEYFRDYYDMRNGGEGKVQWVGVLNTSRFYLEK